MRFDYKAYQAIHDAEAAEAAAHVQNPEAAVEPIEEPVEVTTSETDVTEEGGANDDAGNGESIT